MKQFSIPFTYRSSFISAIKESRRQKDKMKKDFSPTILNWGPVQFLMARHFGFCYGVENAIEIAFRTVDNNPGKNIYLLSEMIHNPSVNKDLLERGVKFLQDTKGNSIIPIDTLTAEDIVIIPAFGTTIEMENKLKSIGITIEQYNTTCPFVEKVWNRSEQIAKKNYTVIVHGKPTHEETRATFSHAAEHTPTLVINDMEEAVVLADFIKGNKPVNEFYITFKGRFSEGFDAERDLKSIGVVNQTTMLASDTQAIADFLKQTMMDKFQSSEKEITTHFADTRDTLCYATNDNQSAVHGMLEHDADLAIVIGGFNSSNTSHLVELCELKLPTYYIDHADKIISKDEIIHFDFHHKTEKRTTHYLPQKEQVKIMVTSGASCPDSIVESVMEKISSYFISKENYEDGIKAVLEFGTQA